jgi:hypothetical protein
MPDARRVHSTQKPSLLNEPLYNGPANALYKYGPRGPAQDYNRGRARKPLSTPPETIDQHIDDALAHVANLSPKLRSSVKQAMLTMTRDLSFVRMIAEQVRGPHSEAAVHGMDSQGNAY